MIKRKEWPRIKAFIGRRMKHGTQVRLLAEGMLSFETERIDVGPFLIVEDPDGEIGARLRKKNGISTDATEAYVLGNYILYVYGGKLEKIYRTEHSYYSPEKVAEWAPLVLHGVKPS